MPRDEAARRGARVLTQLPDGRFMVSTHTQRGLAVVTPASKISAAVTPDRRNSNYLVVFHSDVDRAEAERILLSTGVPRIENPDLIPSQLLVSATEEQLRALAEWDEVAYIFPASEELAKGQPLLGCIGPLMETGVLAQYVATVGQGWDGAGQGSVELTYSLTARSNHLPADVIVSMIERATAEWGRYAAVRFHRGSNPQAARNIHVMFASGHHGDAYPFDGPGRVLAHTFYPAGVNPEPIAGDMHLDDDETWTDGGQQDLYSVILHELGHALGLAHSDRPGSVMYPYYSRLNGLAQDDIAAIQRLYAKPAPSDPVAPPQTPQLPKPPPPQPPPSQPSQPQQPQPSPVPSGPDTSAPSITITSPGSSSYSTSAETVTIRGTARDNVGVHQVTWQRGGDAGVATGTTNWSFTLPLLRGTNTVIVKAYDAAGKSSWRTIMITRR